MNARGVRRSVPVRASHAAGGVDRRKAPPGGQSVLLSTAQKTAEISLPVAITVFPDEVYRAPETWARRAYRNLIYFHEVDRGGHFAAWEEPALFATEIQAAFRSLR